MHGDLSVADIEANLRFKTPSDVCADSLTLTDSEGNTVTFHYLALLAYRFIAIGQLNRSIVDSNASNDDPPVVLPRRRA